MKIIYYIFIFKKLINLFTMIIHNAVNIAVQRIVFINKNFFKIITKRFIIFLLFLLMLQSYYEMRLT